MHVYDVILNRHSVRKFSDQTIEDSIVEKILNAARLAPSWRNQQCWHFIVVKDKSTKDKIIRCTQYFNQSWLGNEPVIIVFCGDPQQSGFNNQQPYYLVDTAIAYTQMMLSATDWGLGTCFIAAFDEKKLKEVLGIPDNIRVVGLTPLGYPAEKKGIIGTLTSTFIKSHQRKEFDQIVSLNHWDQPYKTEDKE